jgi:hypothetical protein
LRRSRWRCAILLLLSRISSLLWLLLLRRLVAGGLRLLEALVLLLVLRISRHLRLKTASRIAGILLLEGLLLLLTEASRLLRLEGRWLSLEASCA